MKLIYLGLMLSIFSMTSLAKEPDSNSAAYIESLVKKGNKVLAFKVAKNFYESHQTTTELTKLFDFSTKHNLNKLWNQFLDDQLKLNPYHANINYYKAMSLIAENKFELAEQLAILIMNTSEQKILALKALVAVAKQKQDFATAIKLVNEQIEADGTDFELYFERSKLHFKTGQPKRAQIDLDSYILKKAHTEDSFILQHDILAISNHELKIKSNLRHCLELISAATQCFASYLKLYPGKKDAFAIEYFEKYRNSFEKNFSILHAMALQYEENGFFERAESAYKQITLIESDRFEYTKHLLKFYEKNRKVHLAFATISQFLSLFPNNAEAISYQQAILSHNRFKVVESSDKQVADKNAVILPMAKMLPDKSNQTAQQLFYTENYSYLIANSKLLEPIHKNYYFRLGNVYFLNGQTDLAISAWQKVTTTTSVYENSVYNAAIAMSLMDLKTKAITLLKAKRSNLVNGKRLQKVLSLISKRKSRMPSNTAYENDVVVPLKKNLNLEWE